MGTKVQKILIVDDDEEIPEILQEAFEKRGWQVDSAFSAQQALEKLKNQEYSLVLCDIRLPKMDGVELKKKVYGELKQRPAFIFMSGAYDYLFEHSEIEEEYDILMKPFVVEDAVNKILDKFKNNDS